MPKTTAERLFSLDTQLDLAIEQLGDAFEAVARRQARDWFAATARFLTQLPTKGTALDPKGATRAGGVVHVLDDASAQGLRHIGKALDRFADVSQHTTRALKVAGIAAKLTPAATEALVAYRQLKLAEFHDLQQTFTTRAASTVRKAALSGQAHGEVLVELNEIFVEWVYRARTLYETAIAEFAQVAAIAKSATSGPAPQTRVYLYTGPADNRLRPFCRHHVGKVLSRGQIDRLDNKQLPNTFLTRGGYNCRHQWRDVTGIPELARLADTGQFASPAIAAKVAAALKLPRSSRKAS